MSKLFMAIAASLALGAGAAVWVTQPDPVEIEEQSCDITVDELEGAPIKPDDGLMGFKEAHRLRTRPGRWCIIY